jgi:hypothetical protein
MTRLLVQGKNNSGHEGTPQTGSLRDSSVTSCPDCDRARSH